MSAENTAKKPQISPTMLAAFLAGAGLGAGTQVIIKPPVPTEPGWICSVLSNNEVLCKTPDQIALPPEDLVVRIDSPDAGSPADAGTK